MKKLTLLFIIILFAFNINAQSYTTKVYEDKNVTNEQELSQLEAWKGIYKKYFNLDIDPSIIKEIEGKWAIFIAKDLTIQQVYDALPFAKWKYDEDLSKVVLINDRIADKDYIIYVDKNVEADEQVKGKSADDLKKMNHNGITLLERLVFELKYFEETGKHLDINKITLCSGSRNSDGSVPCVDWSDDELWVGRFGTSSSDDTLRSRSVVLQP